MNTTTEQARAIDKIIRIGVTKDSGSLFCKIKYSDSKLSISGVEGPTRNGNARGSCGQIVMSEWEFNEYAPDWNAEKVERFREIWDRWHLNDMRANCEHQRANWPDPHGQEVTIYHYKMTSEFLRVQSKLKSCTHATIEAGQKVQLQGKELKIYGADYSFKSCESKAPEGYKLDKEEQKTPGWLYESEHPLGQLQKPCEVCGYKYGSKWIKEEVAPEALSFLEALPETDRKPAWV